MPLCYSVTKNLFLGKKKMDGNLLHFANRHPPAQFRCMTTDKSKGKDFILLLRVSGKREERESRLGRYYKVLYVQ